MLTFDFKPVAARSGGPGRTAEVKPEWDELLDALSENPAVVVDTVKAGATLHLEASGKRKEAVTLNAEGIAKRNAALFGNYARTRDFQIGTSAARIGSLIDKRAQDVFLSNGFHLNDWAVFAYDAPLRTRKAK